MVENRSLVPLGIKDQPLLPPKQQQELLNSARMYLRGLHVNMSADTLRSAMAVMGDATQRGLREEGREELTAKDLLRLFANKGLALREDLKKRAEAILNLSLRNQTSYKELVGPLALPSSLVQAASAESASFYLKGDVSATEQLAQQGETRLALIDPLAQVGLNHLPDSMAVTLDRFSKVSERAKIIRNMIASFVFRDILSPLIPTSELRNFAQMAGTTPAIFSDEALRGLIITLDLDNPGKLYFKDLFIQTAHTFSSPNSLPPREDPRSIDLFYRRFSLDVLLLHPALEEQLIIINPDKVKPESSNLWEGGANFAKFKVPSAEMIAQALRQVEAKKDQFSAITLRQALTYLQWFNEQQVKHISAIAQAQQQLGERRQLIIDISNDPDYPLPKEAYFVRYTYQAEARRRWQAKTNEGERLREIVGEVLDELKEIQRYKAWLKRHYQNELPDQIPMPKRVTADKLAGEEKSLLYQQRVPQRNLSMADDLLRLGYFWQQEQTPKAGVLGKDHNKTWLNRELALTKTLIASVEDDPNAIIFSEAELKYLLSRLKLYFGRSRAPGLPKDLKEMEKIWRNAYVVAERNPDYFYQHPYWQKLITGSLKQRLALLEYAQRVADQKEQLASKRKQVRDRRLDIVYQPQRDIVANDMYWSKDEAKAYLDEMEASAIHQVSNITLDEMAKTALEMSSLIDRYVPLVDLPPQIYSRDQLRNWISGQIKRVESNLPTGLISSTGKGLTRSREVIRLSNRLYKLSRVEKAIDNPLMPFVDGVSLDKGQFMRALKRKVSIAYALAFRRRVINQSEEAKQVYEQTMRRTFREALSRELTSRARQIEKLQARDIGMELVEKMRSLNLVLEEKTPA